MRQHFPFLIVLFTLVFQVLNPGVMFLSQRKKTKYHQRQRFVLTILFCNVSICNYFFFASFLRPVIKYPCHRATLGIGEIMHVKCQAQCLAKSKFSVNAITIPQQFPNQQQLRIGWLCIMELRERKTVIFTLYTHRMIFPKIFATLSVLIGEASHEVSKRNFPLKLLKVTAQII